MKRRFALCIVLTIAMMALAGPALAETAAGPRLLRTEDVFALKTVQDPQISPEGTWVAYTVRSMDPEEDARDTDVWMVPFAGGDAVRLTASAKSETRPRFSPDGRHLAFLSGREGGKTQVWLLDRRGGEAVKLTDYKADVSDLAWSPDGSRLALVVSDVDPDDPEAEEEGKAAGEKDKKKPKGPRPIVIRRLQFKRDGQGYLREIRSHIHVFDVRAKKGFQVTSGPYDDSQPVWSPDGRWIAFTSNRTPDPDANDNSDVFLVAPREGAPAPRVLTASPGADSAPSFSPDGKHVTYVAGGAPEDVWYDTSAVGVVPVGGGPARLLTKEVDRNVETPRFAADGRSVLFLLEDGGNVHLARVPVVGGAVERILAGERAIEAFAAGPRGELAVLESQATYPAEISALERETARPEQATGSAQRFKRVPDMAHTKEPRRAAERSPDAVDGSLRRLTRVNDEFLRGIRLARVERLRVKSPDGQEIDAFLTRPPDAPAGRRLPTVLRIHGGPVAQYSTGFQLEWQLLAAHGYAVVAANPRGSSGYGRAFSRAIFADWGNKDYEDVLAAVDHVIAMGVADPDRLGVGGWSYGGILTDYVVTRTGRFKAATSGASETNYLANYGTDHYQKEWEAELGLPWENTELWIRLSPFFQVERITTPTLLLCAGADVNVPCLNSEQLYQGLRRLGRETELVIYPDQSHSLTRPSFIKDRYDRYLAWYDRYLKPASTQAGGKP